MNKIEVLDKGYVDLLDSMGDDETVVRTSLVCTNTEYENWYETENEGIKGEEKKKEFIASLWSLKHTSPFEFVSFTFEVRAPLFVARQWMRHRTGRYQEKSLRYCKAEPLFYIPGNVLPSIQKQLETKYKSAFDYYLLLLKRGLKKEQARIVLPLSLYTVFRWNIDLHNLLHFIELRLKGQMEIRGYAEALLELISKKVPYTIEAFKKYLKR